MMEWLWSEAWGWLAETTFGFIPTWVWVAAAGLLLGWAWKTFGWQGLVGAALAVLTLGVYRQGWRDAMARAEARKQGKELEYIPYKPKKRKKRTVIDWLKGL